MGDLPVDLRRGGGHNAVVTRRAVAAIVFCAALLVTLGVAVVHPFDPGVRAQAASIESAPSSCAPVDDDGAWTNPHRVTASVTDWVSRCRTLHAHVLPGMALPGPAVSVIEASALHTRTPLGPAYLLHTPLLI